MSVALFDLDNTLLDSDSDYQVGRFLVDEGVVDSQVYEQQNRRFFAQYIAGSLDIYEFARFAFMPLAENTLDHLYRLLEKVTHPVAVDADEQLQKYAHKKGWPTISLKGYT
jgi:phosphoserine phosphatase